MMAKTSRTNARSVSKERTAGQADRYARGSAEIAKACAAEIYGDGYWIMRAQSNGKGEITVRSLPNDEAGELLAKTLDAIQQAR